ncbi:hypothetical protein PYCCODRAFT_1422602 [Trametes coccinea BRFM310]|uniref:Uncharacterized protein n=1 Tax=Trametes coccinea (strain BRFM310) TaxID=1353009 RepID=A0A1Y2IYQ2_TRAC3|nr:hypothetical protein PYCCODRAFT_1422602 [Trametes coccinea BRFM310]
MPSWNPCMLKLSKSQSRPQETQRLLLRLRMPRPGVAESQPPENQVLAANDVESAGSEDDFLPEHGADGKESEPDEDSEPEVAEVVAQRKPRKRTVGRADLEAKKTAASTNVHSFSKAVGTGKLLIPGQHLYMRCNESRLQRNDSHRLIHLREGRRLRLCGYCPGTPSSPVKTWPSEDDFVRFSEEEGDRSSELAEIPDFETKVQVAGLDVSSAVGFKSRRSNPNRSGAELKMWWLVLRLHDAHWRPVKRWPILFESVRLKAPASRFREREGEHWASAYCTPALYTGRRQAGLDVIKDAVISLSLASEGSSSYIVRSFQQSSVVSRFPALTIPPDPNISKSATGCKRGGSYDQTAQPCPRSPIEIPRQPSLVGPLEEKNNTSVDVLSAGSRPSCDAHVQRGSDTSQKEKLRRRMGVFHHEILHLQFLSAASDFLPGPFHRPPRNPAEKISSGYKCWEFLNWFYGLVSALLFNTLPRPYWVHICQLVAGVRIVFQRRSTASQRQRAHTLLSDLAYNYKGNLRQPKSSLAIHLLSSIPGNQALVRSMTGDDIAILKYIEANVGTSQAREDWLPNGQICRSAWKEVPNQMTRISRNVKYHADGEGEVQYYFRCPIGDKTETLALVSRYSLPNETLLNLSSGVVWACRAPGDSHRHLEQDACELPIGGAVAAAIPPGLPGQLSEAEAIQTADLAEKALIPVKKPFL